MSLETIARDARRRETSHGYFTTCELDLETGPPLDVAGASEGERERERGVNIRLDKGLVQSRRPELITLAGLDAAPACIVEKGS